MIRVRGLAPKKSTHVTEALRKKEGSHDEVTLSWVAALWDPLHRINDQVKRARGNTHVLIKSFRESLPRYALIQLRFECSKECFYTPSMRFNALLRLEVYKKGLWGI